MNAGAETLPLDLDARRVAQGKLELHNQTTQFQAQSFRLRLAKTDSIALNFKTMISGINDATIQPARSRRPRPFR